MLSRYFKSLLAIPLLVSGCCAFGPCDGYFLVSGTIPQSVSEPCLLDVSTARNGARGNPRKVSGIYEVSFVINPPWKGHKIELECDGKLVISRMVNYGKEIAFGEVLELGEIAL